jgi:hypothetical protein
MFKSFSTSEDLFLVKLLQDQKNHSDQKKGLSVVKAAKSDSDQKLNYCCAFCNNLLVYEAAKRGDVNAVKKLLSDYDNITNPFQSYSYFTKENALIVADKAKNKELIKVLVKEMKSKKERE